MSHSKFLPVIAIAALFAFSGDIRAQGSSLSGSSSETASPVLRVQLVITRFAGEKKVGSIPYTFTVVPGRPGLQGDARLRMGVDMPITTNGSLQYKNVGTSIDCNNIQELPGGRYAMSINVQNTAAVPDAGELQVSAPLFRSFSTIFTALLRDGQSMQTVASSDPVSGEVVKIDVTLNVIK